MSTRKKPLKLAEIKAALDTSSDPVPPIISTSQLAKLVGISCKTLYEWISRGRLDGSFRKRGKRVLFWRDRAIEIIFNGKDWSDVG